MGFGERKDDPDSPCNQGKGWEGVCSGKGEPAMKVNAPFHGSNGLRATLRARKGPGFRAQRLCSEARCMALSWQTPLYNTTAYTGAALRSHKPFLGVHSTTSFNHSTLVRLHVVIICKEFYMKLVTMNRSAKILNN